MWLWLLLQAAIKRIASRAIQDPLRLMNRLNPLNPGRHAAMHNIENHLTISRIFDIIQTERIEKYRQKSYLIYFLYFQIKEK